MNRQARHRLNPLSSYPWRHGSSVSTRRGQALLELALLIPIIILLIGATISFGLFFFQANVLQQAVDVAAQEISRMPFEPDQSLGLGVLNKCNEPDLVCNDSDFKAQIYDEQYLVIRESQYAVGTGFNGDLQAFVASLPLLNRLLFTVMVPDQLPSGEAIVRYPGALVMNDAEGYYTVLVPLVAYNYQGVVGGFQCSGETLIQWVSPVEEILADHDDDSATSPVGPYSLAYDVEPTLASFSPGMVALRINYPAQSTTLVNRTSLPAAQNPEGQVGQVLVVADDTVLAEDELGPCYSLVVAANTPAANVSAPQGGRFGLGSLPVLKGSVRPYRKVMSFQAIYRREVFH